MVLLFFGLLDTSWRKNRVDKMVDIDELNDKLDTILNNHLHHMQEDMNSMNDRLLVVETRMDNILDFMRQNYNKMLLALIAIAGASVGLPMAGVM